MQGLIIINKPKGFTSQDVVSKTKKILNIKKAGHTGTLDPLATGVLPVLLGDYTKLSKYLIDHDKVYQTIIKLGEKSETGDLEGKIVETSAIKVMDQEKIKEILNSMIGKQMQVPPMYSAIKVNGRKLYEYARAGEDVEVQPREIEIYKLELIEFNQELQELKIEVSCSKGTYIRVLCEDVAKKLGTVGLMKELQRVKVDNFCIENSITFEMLEKERSNAEFWKMRLFKMKEIFKNYPSIELDEAKRKLFINGGRIKMLDDYNDGIYNIYIDNKYIGLGIVKEHKLKRDIVINE